jgi:hypothetical protein
MMVCRGFGLVWFGLVWFGLVWFGLVGRRSGGDFKGRKFVSASRFELERVAAGWLARHLVELNPIPEAPIPYLHGDAFFVRHFAKPFEFFMVWHCEQAHDRLRPVVENVGKVF